MRFTPIERSTLVVCLLLSGAILLGPRQWASSAFSFALGLLALSWHRRRLREEAATEPVGGPAREIRDPSDRPRARAPR